MRNYRRKYDLMVPVEKFIFVVYRGVNEIMNTDFFSVGSKFQTQFHGQTIHKFVSSCLIAFSVLKNRHHL